MNLALSKSMSVARRLPNRKLAGAASVAAPGAALTYAEDLRRLGLAALQADAVQGRMRLNLAL